MEIHTWFECKIQHEKTIENGLTKVSTETYLVDALSFTEAEARITEEMAPFVMGGFKVLGIKKAKYSELFAMEDGTADKWFKGKLVFITLDEKSGKEKKQSTNILIHASDLADALKKTEEGMAGTMGDYSIASLAETPIMDVFPYEAPASKPEVEQ